MLFFFILSLTATILSAIMLNFSIQNGQQGFMYLWLVLLPVNTLCAIVNGISAFG